LNPLSATLGTAWSPFNNFASGDANGGISLRASNNVARARLLHQQGHVCKINDLGSNDGSKDEDTGSSGSSVETLVPPFWETPVHIKFVKDPKIPGSFLGKIKSIWNDPDVTMFRRLAAQTLPKVLSAM